MQCIARITGEVLVSHKPLKRRRRCNIRVQFTPFLKTTMQLATEQGSNVLLDSITTISTAGLTCTVAVSTVPNEVSITFMLRMHSQSVQHVLD